MATTSPRRRRTPLTCWRSTATIWATAAGASSCKRSELLPNGATEVVSGMCIRRGQGQTERMLTGGIGQRERRPSGGCTTVCLRQQNHCAAMLSIELGHALAPPARGAAVASMPQISLIVRQRPTRRSSTFSSASWSTSAHRRPQVAPRPLLSDGARAPNPPRPSLRPS